MKEKNKFKGYTLIELLVGTGVLSLASIGLYTIAMVANDWRKSSQEVKSLNVLMKEIDNSTITVGTYEGISLTSLNHYSDGFVSALTLNEIVSHHPKRLNFIYDGVNSRICNDFVGKMLQSSRNIGAIVNDKSISDSEGSLASIASACDSNYGRNNVVIVLNKTQDDYTIDNVVASVNPPSPSPFPDMTVPNVPIPQVFPGVVPYIPGTVEPGTFPIVTEPPS